MKARFTKRVLHSLAKLRASLQAERKNYGHQHHYAIYLPPSDRRKRFQYVFLHFSRFWYEILLFIKFFCWIGLDLILFLIPFCFPSLSLSLFSNICVHSFFFFFFLGFWFGKHLLICFTGLKHLLIAFGIKENKPLKSVNCNQKEREREENSSEP